jgi:FkbH-like protein
MQAKTEAEATPSSSRADGKGRSADPARHALTVLVAATFTAEPIEAALGFWLRELGYQETVAFAPYNQVLQQLIDPRSALGRNTGGVNVVLVRFEDWARFRKDGADEETVIRAGVDELSAALRAYAGRSATPVIVCVCPPTPGVAEDPKRAAFFAAMEAKLGDEIAGLGPVHRLDKEILDLYPVETVYDPKRDQIGHIPYTPLYYTALGTAVARLVQAIRSEGYKVIALDCDNTLWKGVVGEDGPHGITFPAGIRALHEFVVRQHEAGMLVCLVSKNVEQDVLEVFEVRPELGLRREQIVAIRVNWASKAENIAALAAELNLGIDSFIFLDDNPIECAEMRAVHPGVLTLQLPADDAEIPGFLRHVWAFDRLRVTEEDRRRTQMYRENAERRQFEEHAGSIDAFLAGLDLKIDIDAPSEDQIPRVAQLTQRTNQFNFTTIRRSEAEIRQLSASGHECLRVLVSDRFGDYGLVGLTISGNEDDAVGIDTMLLSCRVLGRGVEHAMLAHLGRLAQERGKARVDTRFSPTAKNLPAANFLESVASAYREDQNGGAVYRIPAEVAASLRYAPGADAADQLELAREKTPASPSPSNRSARDKSSMFLRIATELRPVEAVLRAIEQGSLATRPDLETPFVAPRTEREEALAGLWKQLLGLDRVGIHDDFAALGGTSLKAAHLFVEIEERFGKKLPMTTIIDAPTIEQLAERIDGKVSDVRESLKRLRPGGPGPALFLIHDGDGETLLYLNLARRLPEGVAVFGIEPLANGRCPILHTRIPEMAAYYAEQIRKVQPEGPYFLGGMCAGGTIAFEVALQLEARGQDVGFVALLDSADPQAPPRVGLSAERRWASFQKGLKDGSQGSALKRLGLKAAKAARKVRNLAVYELTNRTRKLSAQVRFGRLRQAIDRGRPIPRLAQGLSVRNVYNLAEKEYAPERLLEAPAILFRATEGEGADEPFIRRYNDPLLGWGGRVQDGPEVVEMPGGHSSMLQEPHVAVMAERITSGLRSALSVVEVAS